LLKNKGLHVRHCDFVDKPCGQQRRGTDTRRRGTRKGRHITCVSHYCISVFCQMDREITTNAREFASRPMVQLSALRHNTNYVVLKAVRVFCLPEGFSFNLTLMDPYGYTPRAVLAFEYGNVFTDVDISNIIDKKIWFSFRILKMFGRSYVIDIS
jgi:hypothetical protein